MRAFRSLPFARVLLSLCCCLFISLQTSSARHLLAKRQTFHYPGELREYAQNYHSGTRVIHGTLGRFAPQDWPAWYTRTLFKWNGESRLSPYSPNDVQYRSWRMSKFISDRT